MWRKLCFDAVRKEAWERRELHENQEGGGPEGGERGGGEQEVVRRAASNATHRVCVHS